MPRALTLTNRFVAACVLFSALHVAPGRSAGGDGPARGREKSRSGDEPKRVVKVYLVDDLVLAPSDYPFEANLPTATPFEHSDATSRLLGGGGSGGGAGGGGGGGGGMGGGMTMGRRPVLNRQAGGARRMPQLVNLLEAVVKGDWHDDSDSADRCIVFGNNLIVRQTEEGQHQITALLDALRSGNAPHSVTVAATWIWLDAQKREALRTTANSATDATAVRGLLQNSAAFAGQITCLNGQTVHFATGERRVISSGAQPTVGVGASAYMLKTDVVNVGVVLEVTPAISRERRMAYVDLHSVATQWGTPGEPLQVASQSFAGSHDTDAKGTLVMNLATIDRVNLGTQELSTSASIPLNTPVLVGSVTFAEPGDKTVSSAPAKRPELGLVIEVRPSN
jgi:hypothetical protein